MYYSSFHTGLAGSPHSRGIQSRVYSKFQELIMINCNCQFTTLIDFGLFVNNCLIHLSNINPLACELGHFAVAINQLQMVSFIVRSLDRPGDCVSITYFIFISVPSTFSKYSITPHTAPRTTVWFLVLSVL